MNTHDPAGVSDQPSADRLVACAKCEHLNPVAKRHCAACGERLYITCRYCGQKNARAESHCTECLHRLHRPFWRKLKRRLFPKNSKIKAYEILLLIITVLITYKLIIKIAEMSASSGESYSGGE